MAKKKKRNRKDERRKHPRVPLQLLVQYRSDNYAEFMEKFAPNISSGGMFIETKPREKGTMLYFQFTTSTDGSLIEGLGRVVRVVEEPNDETKAGVGIEFVNLMGKSREVINEIITARISDAV